MNCNICHRPHHATKLPFLCAVDARNQLYESRLELARAMIENEKLEGEINHMMDDAETTSPNTSPKRPSRAVLDQWKSDEAAAVDRTKEIIAQAERLKAEIDAARKEMAAKKEANARKRSDVASVSKGLETRRARLLEESEKAIQRTKYKWNRNSETMAATRAFLCEEAARLYGLRQIKKGNNRRYEIGGVEIVELHNMHNVAPEITSTSLAHITHILVITSNYLAVRLPAEITLPHRDYPKPTIFTLPSSYHHGEVPFPGSVLPPQTGQRGTDQHVPRPRPLFIDKPLPTLAKDDPQQYSFFLEGVSLLAYNIAWLCCSQGVSVGDKSSHEDLCNIGQNLWRLLIGDQIYRKSVEPTFPSALTLTPPNGSPRELTDGTLTGTDLAKPKTQIGHWSHGTTHTSLAAADGTEFIRNFKLLAPLKLFDHLKKRLSTEAPMLEWEKIEGEEADDFDEGVYVRERRSPGSGGGREGGGREELGMESVMSVRPVHGAEQEGTPTKGWTKLKGR